MTGLLAAARSLLSDIWESAPRTDWAGLVLPSKPTLEQPSFATNANYFTLRLTEMRLRAARVGLVDYVPACLVVADYFYDGAYRSLPFVVSQDKMRSAVETVRKEKGAAPIEMYDTLIVGPVPVRATEVGLFVGLFRIQRSDKADMLLDVIGSLGSAAGLSALTAGLPLARTVYDSVKKVFGQGSADQLVGTRLGFSFDANTTAPTLRGGHIAYTSLPRGAAGEHPFELKQGRLARASASGPTTPVTDCDYALVAVEHSPARKSFEDLAFHSQFTALQRRLIESPGWDWKPDWLRLMSAIRTSPDLTRPDTTVALASYRAQIDEEIEVGPDGTKPAGEVSVFRSGGAASAVSNILAAAVRPEVGQTAYAPPRGPELEAGDDAALARETNAAKRLTDTVAAIRKSISVERLPDPDALAAELMERDFPGSTG